MHVLPSRATVASAMSPCHLTIGPDQLMSEAARIMRHEDIRHLPVLEGGQLCGVVSERDLLLTETLVGFESRHATVSEAMTLGVYAVTSVTPLALVLRTMALQKYGCAVVIDGGKVVGIITTVDVCRLLADMLDRPTTT